jgi:NTE family protein
MRKRTVSLILGSGGARGLAHIGVIDALLEHDLSIRSIAGTSMGALVGGIYATGKLDAYTRWVSALERREVLQLLDFAYDFTGLFKGERLFNLMRDLIGDVNIEELSIAFTAVATDLHTQREVWLNKGPLFNAIRASISIPTIFTPFEYQGRQLLDGALVNPIPIAPTLNDKTDLIIVVNLNAPASIASPEKIKDEPAPVPTNQQRYHRRIARFVESLYQKRERDTHSDLSMIDIATRSMDTMQQVIARFRMAAYSPDIVINVPSNACAFHEFYRAKEMIALGHELAHAALLCLGPAQPSDR